MAANAPSSWCVLISRSVRHDFLTFDAAMIGTLVALVVFTTSLEGAGTPLPPPIPHVPTADELGIRPSYTESASGGPWLEKRVGEEDE